MGSNLTCSLYGVVQFLGCQFNERVRIYGYGFQQFFHIFLVYRYGFFVKIHLLVSFFGISGFMGTTFRKLSGSMGILSKISPDLWAVVLRFEWHSPVP